MLQYQIIPVTDFHQNCTILWCDETQHAAVIDPGGEAEKIMAAIEAAKIKLTHILLTHGHLDHVGAAVALAQHYGVEITGPHQADNYWFAALPQQSEKFGLPIIAPFTPDHWLEDNAEITIGKQRLNVYHTPGHTPGHVIYYSPCAQLAQVGDVLFAGSIGRTDFPGGNYQELINSIEQKLWPLGEEVEFIAGHGPMSTFAIEQQSNPFVGKLR